MRGLQKKINTEIGRLNIRSEMFSPLDSATSIRAEIDRILKESRPKIVSIRLPPRKEYAAYSNMFRETILPYLVRKSGEYGYKIISDRKLFEIGKGQAPPGGVKGNYNTGYSLSPQSPNY